MIVVLVFLPWWFRVVGARKTENRSLCFCTRRSTDLYTREIEGASSSRIEYKTGLADGVCQAVEPEGPIDLFRYQ